MRTQSTRTTGQGPGDFIRSQWLAESCDTGTARHEARQDANRWRLACERQANSIALPAAEAYYATLWPRIRFLTEPARCGRRDPTERAAAKVAVLSQTVLALHAKMVSAQAAGSDGASESARKLVLACGDLDSALDTLHERLEGHLTGRACQPRINGKVIALAVGRLLLGLVLIPLAILATVVIAGQSLALVLSAVGLIVDGVAAVAGEAVRCRRAQRLPAALHLYPSHREALRRWAQDTGRDGVTVLQGTPDAAAPSTNSGSA